MQISRRIADLLKARVAGIVRFGHAEWQNIVGTSARLRRVADDMDSAGMDAERRVMEAGIGGGDTRHRRSGAGGPVPSREAFLRDFPESPVDQVFSSPEDIARCYSLDRRATETVVEAYGIALKHFSPFNTWIADSILHDLRREASLNPRKKFAFLGRDGHIIAAGVRGRDPVFFRERCTEIVVSRPVMEMVARDYERRTGTVLRLGSDFRTDLEKRGMSPELLRQLVPGSFDNFVSYLERKGLGDGDLTVIDNGLRGSAQEIITHVLDGRKVNGHYAFLSISPDDPNPGAKKGHVYHLPASEWQGGNAKFLPEDPSLTFLYMKSLWTIESLIPGPARSAVAMTPRGPDQTPIDIDIDRPRGKFPGPIDETYREPGVEKYWEPRVEEASRVSIHLAAAHHAQSGAPGNLENFTDQTRKWLQRDEDRDPDLARLMSGLSLYGAH